MCIGEVVEGGGGGMFTRCAWTKLVLLSLQRRNLGSIAKVLQHAAAGKLVSLLWYIKL